MEELFIPYDTALIIIEKGFKKNCFGSWMGYNKNDANLLLNGIMVGRNWDFICHAPTYQQAFKWFRDNHNLNGEVYQVLLCHNNEEMEQEINNSEYTFRINVKGIPQFQSTDNIYSSYEEAELYCLKELIKLI